MEKAIVFADAYSKVKEQNKKGGTGRVVISAWSTQENGDFF